MKKIKGFIAGLVIISLVSLPVIAAAHSHGSGGAFFGFGVGLLSGFLLAPKPVYVVPPVYVAPPPAVYAQMPNPPQGPAAQTPSGPPAPSPGAQAKCREWRLIDRHLEDRWDSYAGKWQSVPVEKWGWVEVPCEKQGAAVQGNVSPPPPPQYVLPEPPPVAVIPGTYVYVVPDVTVDILFYHGYWYRPYGRHWYRALSYNGPWIYLGPGGVPRAILELPPGYRRLPPGYHRIPYAHLHANWGRWERERYWHNDREWREGRGHH
jgi:hypothetical protein